MSSKRVANIFANDNELSQETKRILKQKLVRIGFVIEDDITDESELVFCVGGDGGFLRTLQNNNFPNIPFIGINTGHLGFFQDLSPEKIDEFIFRYQKEDYEIETLKTVRAIITDTDGKEYVVMGLNEIVFKSASSKPIHLNLSLDNSFVERFSGDGILVATPAGSTAYNYALGGCIVDPRISLLQITPIAPMNTLAYRSFTSSVVVPNGVDINIHPEPTFETRTVVAADGFEFDIENIEKATVAFSDKEVKLIKLGDNDFWGKVKSKFL